MNDYKVTYSDGSSYKTKAVCKADAEYKAKEKRPGERVVSTTNNKD